MRRKSLSDDGSAKRCSACKEWKPVADFSRDASHWSGLAHACRACKRAYARTISTPRLRAYRIRQLYGMAAEEYQALLLQQGGVCGICGSDDAGRHGVFNVDHDHSTGQTRGLLCDPCNLGLGKFRDDPAILSAALAYLQKYAP